MERGGGDVNDMKRCSKCGEMYPATSEYYYRKSIRGRYKLTLQCKVCINKQSRKNKGAHKRYQDPSDVYLEQQQAFERKIRRRRYGEVRKIRDQNRRARARAMLCDFTIEQRNFAVNYFNNVCAVCGEPFYDLFGERTLALDHWIPINAHDCPGTTATNMIPLCHGKNGCNNSKLDYDPHKWLVKKFGRRKAREILARIEAYFDAVRERFGDDVA